MNADHYRRVSRALAKSRFLMQKQFAIAEAQMDRHTRLPDSLMPRVRSECANFWKDEFPDDLGYGDSASLDLSGADFSGYIFAGDHYDFPIRAPLNRADLTGAKLDRTIWYVSHLKHANLTNASLRDSTMFYLCCEGATFHSADLSGSEITLVFAKDSPPADFRDTNLSGARLLLFGRTPLILRDARMDGCRITTAEPSGESQDRLDRQRLEQEVRRAEETLNEFMASLSQEQRAAIIVEEPVVTTLLAKAAVPASRTLWARALARFGIRRG